MMEEPTVGVSLTSSHDGGRPPESITHVTFNQPLERVGSPLAAEDQPVVKRGRNDSVAMDNMEVSESMEMEADGMLSSKEQVAPTGDVSTDTQHMSSYAHVVRDSLRGKDHKRRCTPQNKPSGGRQDMVARGPRGSRFAVLDSDAMVADTITREVEVFPQISDEVAPTGKDVQVGSGPGIVQTVTFGVETPQRKPMSSSASSSRFETIPMQPGNAITVVEHRPHGASKDHQAVSLLEQGHGSNGVDTGKSQAGRGFKLKSAKENGRQGLMIRKPSPAKTISRPVLSEWVDNVNQQLNSIAHRKELDPGGNLRLFSLTRVPLT
ncbi:hypothetical protein V6N11_011541 [Hibiscus sabdariffa]|uniref:Uncharacterized protein n=1 Tax=Hibiscus sabdariffa TaxID=183260 RepID=A0ABR2S8J6_9ROSI